jgi:hypothetical protein
MTRRPDVFPPPRGPSGTPVAPPAVSERAAPFRQTLVRVMLVQLVTLVVLWLLQARYTP